eukprot:m.21002 g.21002  ORF g.21002 m.21002 type:complete len:508 (-) comp12598_c0_seq2:103-1626(-)
MQRVYLIAALCLAVGVCYGEPPKEVKQLPGWQKPLPSKLYSGYCNAGVSPSGQGAMFQHYIYWESENDPANDPTVIWYQGGPGATSLFGVLVEFGPLLTNAQSLNSPFYHRTGIPELIYNPHTWTKVANLIIIDNPAPVGFSYCEPAGPTGDGYSCGNWTDALVATANRECLADLAQQLPQLTSQEVFIFGESYAGVYVPIIIQALLDNPTGINLKGFGVGDGCMGTDVICGADIASDVVVPGPYWQIEFMHGHGQVSNKLYYQIHDTCPEADLRSGALTPTCQALVKQMNDAIGGYFSYNLYDQCYTQDVIKNANERSYTQSKGSCPANDPDCDSSSPQEVNFFSNGYPCAGDVYMLWLNQSSVRTALHVPVNANFFSGDNGVGFNYELTERNVLPIYKRVLSETDLRVLSYNGDTDPAINSMLTQDRFFDYFDNENFVTETEAWRPWTLDGKKEMGGYLVSYGSQFTYVTVRGSGHMVPEYEPRAGLKLFSLFLKNEPFPTFNKD